MRGAKNVVISDITRGHRPLRGGISQEDFIIDLSRVDGGWLFFQLVNIQGTSYRTRDDRAKRRAQMSEREGEAKKISGVALAQPLKLTDV